jgi:hypothetical protein
MGLEICLKLGFWDLELRFLDENASPFATQTKRAYTGAVRGIWKKIRYRLEWLALAGAAKILPLLSRNA